MLIKNIMLSDWINENYPLMDLSDENDLCELDYNDFEKFAIDAEKRIIELHKNIESLILAIHDR